MHLKHAHVAERRVDLDQPRRKPAALRRIELRDVAHGVLAQHGHAAGTAAVTELAVRVRTAQLGPQAALPRFGGLLEAHQIGARVPDRGDRLGVSGDAVVHVVRHHAQVRLAGSGRPSHARRRAATGSSAQRHQADELSPHTA